MRKMMLLFRTVAVMLCLFSVPIVSLGVTIDVKTEGTLEQIIEDCDEPSFKELKIVGRINAVDIKYLRTNSGRLASIETLDLSDVTIVLGGGAYATVAYSDYSVTMNNYSVVFYSSDINHSDTIVNNNGLGGLDYTINVYNNNLAGAFAGMDYGRVVMPNGVNEIGIMTFYECRNLKAIKCSQPLRAVEVKAFQSCTSLLDLDLSQVNRMGFSAFAGCKSFRSTTEGTLNLSSLNAIPDNAFGISNIKYEGVTSCQSIKNIVFSKGLKSIGTEAFRKCLSLETISLPEGLQSIGDNAFADCTSLQEVSLPSTLKRLNPNMFENTPYLQNSLIVEDRIVYWNTIAVRFKATTNPQENEKDYVLSFREGTTEIADGFWDSNYTNSAYYTPKCIGVILPSSLRRIGNDAFGGCVNIKEINLPEGLEEIADGGAFSGTGITTIVIPHLIKRIGTNTFAGCSNLETIFLPVELEEIGRSAFSGCIKLSSFPFSESVKTIEHEAFSGCSSLSEITIPKNVERLGSNIFKGASLWRINYNATNAINIGDRWSSGGEERISFNDIFTAERVVIGSDVRSLPISAFASSSVKRVTFEERTDDAELTIGELCFTGSSITSITLPKGKIEIGGGAFHCPQLSSFNVLGVVTKIYDTDGGATIGNGYDSPLTCISFPDGLTYVGNHAFEKNTNISSINLGNSVKYIGESAFDGCGSLTDIQVGNLIDSIGIRAFNQCEQLRSFNFGNCLKKIGIGAFLHCEALEEVSLPSSLEVIEGSAFALCNSLKIVYLPEGLKELGDKVFSGCDLSELIIPSTATKIGNYLLGEYGQDPYLNRNLKNIESHIQNPWEISDYTVFLNYYFNNTTLRVPAGTLQTYRNTYPWSQFNRIKEIGSENADNTLVVENVTIPTGRTKLISIDLKNQTSDYTAFQFELVLPDGLSIGTDAKGAFDVRKGSRFKDKNQSLTVEKVDNQRYRFVGVSLSNGTITGTEGEILSFSLQASETMPTGNYTAYIEDVVFLRQDGTKHELYDIKIPVSVTDGDNIKLGDTNNDGVIDVADAVSMINFVLGNASESFVFFAADLNGDGEVDVFDITKLIRIILTSNSKKSAYDSMGTSDGKREDVFVTVNGNTLNVNLEEAGQYTAFQLDVELPVGIRLENVVLNESMNGHLVKFAKNSNGLYTVVVMSMSNEPLTNDAHKLLEFRLSDNLNGEIHFSNIVFVTPNEQQDCYHDIIFKVTTDINSLTAPPSNVIYDMYGRKFSANRQQLGQGIYVVNQKKVIVK